MFIEVNEIGRYCNNDEKLENGNWKYKPVIIGKIIINTDEIRCISINGFEWEDSKKYLIKDGSQRYTVYFDKDRSINIDIESYNKIKNYLIKENETKTI